MGRAAGCSCAPTLRPSCCRRSWDRDVPIGYRIAHVQLSEDGRTAVGHSIFAEGWLGSDGKKWGRPVGLARLPDGSMLVADDKANTVYRISYDGTAGGAGAASSPSPPPPTPVASAGSKLLASPLLMLLFVYAIFCLGL